MKRDKILYWVFTGLLSVYMLLQSFMFIVNTEMVYENISHLGFPEWILQPLGIAKVLAVIAILYRKVEILKKLAYLGLLVDFVLALGSHLMAGDMQWPPALVATALLLGSWFFERKLLTEP